MSITKRTVQFTIGYIRKSTDTEDKQVRSLADQEKLVREQYENLPQEEKMYLLKIMHESRSAYHPGRPVFNEMMEMANNKQVRRIMVLDPTRLSRNMEDAGKLIQKLADGKIHDVLTVSGKNYSRQDTTQLLMLMLETTMGWKDSADKGARVKIGMKQKAKEGGSTGPAPIGYKNMGMTKGKKWWDIDPDAGPKVKSLFILASTSAYSLSALCKEAKKIGLRTKPTRKHINGLPIKHSTMHQVLRNPAYKALKVYQGDECQASHVPLVESEVWERVQIVLSGRRTNTCRSKDGLKRELFLLAGCTRCGKCKTHTMSPEGPKKGKYIYYSCKNRNSHCSNSIEQTKLLDQFYEALSLLQIEDDDMSFMRKTMGKDHELYYRNFKGKRDVLEREFAQNEKDIGDIFNQREDARKMGVLDTIDAKLAALKTKKDELQAALNELNETSDDWIDHVLKCFELVKLAQEAVKYGSPAARGAIIKALGSNYYVCDGKLVCDWVSPFRQRAEKEGRTKWLPQNITIKTILLDAGYMSFLGHFILKFSQFSKYLNHS